MTNVHTSHFVWTITWSLHDSHASGIQFMSGSISIEEKGILVWRRRLITSKDLRPHIMLLYIVVESGSHTKGRADQSMQCTHKHRLEMKNSRSSGRRKVSYLLCLLLWTVFLSFHSLVRERRPLTRSRWRDRKSSEGGHSVIPPSLTRREEKRKRSYIFANERNNKRVMSSNHLLLW